MLTDVETRFAAAQDLDALKELFEAEIAALGYRYFDVFSFSASQLSNPEQGCRFYATNYLSGAPWNHLPKDWPDGCGVMQAAMHQVLPIDYLGMLRQVPPRPIVVLQRALLKLWKVRHSWVVPLNTPHFVQMVTVYMIDGSEEAFRASRTQIMVLASAMMQRMIALHPLEAQGEAAPVRLTPEETACLTGIARGLKNAEIAAEMGVTPHTVRYHLKKLFKKLGVANRAEAAVVGLRLGLGA